MNIVGFSKNLLFPPKCVLCTFTMEPNTHTNICGKCADALRFCSESFCCERCGKPIISFEEERLCYFCANKSNTYFDKIVSLFEYDGMVKEAILRYKRIGIQKYAAVYAQIMAAKNEEEYRNIDFDFLCGAPSHKNRKTSKGFDHIEEICSHFSKITGIKRHRGALVKTRATEKQHSLNYEMRMKNLVGSMALKKGLDVKGATVLLIDDVCTTRATVIECAKTLKENGAKAVYALTFATTVKTK